MTGFVAETAVEGKILIAVDFGTTHSAAAWANTLDPDAGDVVTEWGSGPTTAKVPTIIKYENNGVKWGQDLKDNMGPEDKVHEWFKLALCPEVEAKRATRAELLRNYPSKTALPAVRGKECRIMVVAYLKEMHRAIEKQLKHSIASLPREYIITVPAMWPEEAQNATRACAAEAFLGDPGSVDKIQIVAEPEAAGIYALAAMSKLDLNEGDTFVICDAGGGTVDLSSYRIDKFADYIDLERVSILSGDFCGSTLLDRIFESYLETKLGGAYDEWTEPKRRWFRSVVRDNFENQIKPGFTGEKPTRYRINAFGLDDNEAAGIKNQMLKIPMKEILTEVFDKVISIIKDLVREQVNATGNVKSVLLAGGFGQNKYLKSQIELALGNRIPVRKVGIESETSTAIVRGALIAGLTESGALNKRRRPAQQYYPGQPRHQGRGWITPRVYQRSAPKHYGILVCERYDRFNEIHQRGTRIRGVDGTPDMIQRIGWFVKMGDNVPEDESKSFPLTFEWVGERGRQGTYPCLVYSSDAKDVDPPHFLDTPEWHDTAPPKLLLTLDIDLDDVPDWEPTYKSGEVYWLFNFEVHMKMHSAHLSFFLTRGEKTYKPKKVTYESQEK